MASNRLVGLVDNADKEFLRKAQLLQQLIKVKLKKGISIEVAIAQAWREIGMMRKLEKWMADIIKSALMLGVKNTVDLSGAQVLSTFYDSKGVSLSTRLWAFKNQTQKQILDAVNTQLRTGDAFKTMAKYLHDKSIITGDPTQYFKDLEKIGIKALRGDLEELNKFKAKLRAARNYAKKISEGQAPTKRLRAQYVTSLNQMMEAVETGNKKMLDKAIENAIWEKARYNAERLVRTESARAYGQGFNIRMAEDEDAVGFQWLLSPGHNIYDICNFYAEADLHGRGPGVYPKDYAPPYPAHQNCLCSLKILYRGEMITEHMDEDAAKKWLLSQSADRQRELMGVEERKNFKRDPNSWPDLLRNWNGYESKTPRPIS